MEGFFGFLDFRIFLDFSGFFRILISCSNFDLKKINFLIYLFQFLFFIFIFYFCFYFLIILLNSGQKKLSQFLKFPRSMSQKIFLGFPLFSGFFRINPDFLFLVPIFDKFFIFIFL